MPRSILPDSATAEEILDELKTCAASGDRPSLKNVLKKWDSITDMSWFIPNFAERMIQLRNPRSVKTLALHRVLNAAAKEGQTEAVVFLLDQRGCIITQPAARLALVHKRWDVMQLFLDRGWDINSPVEGGNTCSVLREIIPSETHVRWCLEHGADPMFRSAAGTRDILSQAGKIASVKILKILKEHGADFTRSNALHEAALGEKPERIEVMAYLLDEAGVPINQLEFAYDDRLFDEMRGTRLGTALHKAVQGKCLENVRFLLERGIDRGIEDTTGNKAVDLAREYEFEEALTLLQH